MLPHDLPGKARLAASALVTMAAVLAVCPKDAEAGDPRVCFYEHFNYHGHEMCVAVGAEQNNLREVNDPDGFNWNDKISSIKLHGSARTKIYEHVHFDGRTFDMTSDVPDLRALVLADGSKVDFNDVISSFSVYGAP
jgi:hypothetical protein